MVYLVYMEEVLLDWGEIVVAIVPMNIRGHIVRSNPNVQLELLESSVKIMAKLQDYVEIALVFANLAIQRMSGVK